MKNSVVLTLIAFVVLFTSCTKDEGTEEAYLTGTYIINYGNYSGSKSTISSYDAIKNSVYSNVYKNVNDVEISSNVQYAALNDGNIYFMSNDGDKIDIVGAGSFKAFVNPVSENITKPRYIVFDGATAYVSCLGNVTDWKNVGSSYIAKIDLETNTVSKTIALPGGPEGMAIVNNKLYAALNYLDSIAVMDLTSEAISYIQTPAVSSYFLKDQHENLFVSMVSTYNDPSFTTGIGYLNTQTNQLDTVYYLDGVSSNYGSVMVYNKNKTEIFILASAWVEVGEEWVQQGGINTFDIASKSFNTFLGGLEGINAVSVDPVDNMVYCLFGGSDAGRMDIYNEDAVLKSSHATGLSPNQVLFVD